VDEVKGNNLVSGLAAMQGWRVEMEVSVEPSFGARARALAPAPPCATALKRAPEARALAPPTIRARPARARARFAPRARRAR